MLNVGKNANFVKKHHPNKTVAVREINMFDDTVMSHFNIILKMNRKQLTLDSFLVTCVRKELDSSEQ